jgi:hypothetical protein
MAEAAAAGRKALELLARHRELRYFVLVGGAGLLILPFLVYLAGAATLGPYEGGLGRFLGKLYGDFLTLAPGAWALLLGPYAVFTIARLLTRPWRRWLR